MPKQSLTDSRTSDLLGELAGVANESNSPAEKKPPAEKSGVAKKQPAGRGSTVNRKRSTSSEKKSAAGKAKANTKKGTAAKPSGSGSEQRPWVERVRRYTFHADGDTLDAILARAEQTGESKAQIMNRAMRELLERES